MFELAVLYRSAAENDLVPYWVFTQPGGAVIERHVPNLPGAFSLVMEARDGHTGQDVVLKILKPRAAPYRTVSR
jgi:hypothetical protein